MASLEKLVNLVLTDSPVKKARKDLVVNLVYLANRYLVPKVTMVRKVNKDILASRVNQASKAIQGCPDQGANKDRKESLDFRIQVFPDEMASPVYPVKMVVLVKLVHKVKKAKMDRKVFEVEPVQLVKLVNLVHLENRE